MLGWCRRCMQSDEDALREMLERMKYNESKAVSRQNSLSLRSNGSQNIDLSELSRLRDDRWLQTVVSVQSPSRIPNIKDAVTKLIMSMRLHGKSFDVERARRTLCSNWLKEALRPFLPRHLQHREWHKVFATDEHGTLTSAYQQCQQGPGPTVLLIMDTKRHIFGAFNPLPWALQPRLAYYGTGETFLFRSSPSFEVYKWTGDNPHFILCARDSVALGGGGRFGL